MQRSNREAHESALKSPDDYRKTHNEDYNGQWLEPLEITSIAISVYSDFDVAHLPTADGPTPMLIIFPEFRHKAHISTFEAVGHGIAWGVFKIHRCQ